MWDFVSSSPCRTVSANNRLIYRRGSSGWSRLKRYKNEVCFTFSPHCICLSFWKNWLKWLGQFIFSLLSSGPLLRPIIKLTHVLEQTCDGLSRLCEYRRVQLKHWKSWLNVNLPPLPDTLQAGNHMIAWCNPTPQFLPMGQYGLCFGYYVSGHSTFPQKTGHLLWGHFWESLVFILPSKIGQIHLSIEAVWRPHP